MSEQRDNPGDTPSKPNFFEALAADESAWRSVEEVKKEQEQLDREAREENLLDHRCGVVGAITAEDRQAIITGQGLLRTHALAACQRWFNVRSGSSSRPMSMMALVGLSGRGKTMAAAWLLARVGGRYVTAETMRRAFVSTHWRDAGKFDELVAQRCLVIDEAGCELDGTTALAAMNELINRRLGLERAWTLITANIIEEEFRQRYGDRTIRRIEHMGAIIQVKGDDLRRRPE